MLTAFSSQNGEASYSQRSHPDGSPAPSWLDWRFFTRKGQTSTGSLLFLMSRSALLLGCGFSSQLRGGNPVGPAFSGWKKSATYQDGLRVYQRGYRHLFLPAALLLDCVEGDLAVEMTLASAPQLIRTGLWQRLQGTGLERFELLQAADGWVLRGTILALEEQGPAQADYEIFCDAAWYTRHVVVSLRGVAGNRSLRLDVQDGHWIEDGNERETVRGCIDVDLSWSPSTNTLPIRRLGLEVGERSGPVTAAWVRLPELRIEPLSQEYERLAERRYRYSSRGGAFTAELEVDDESVVIDYEGIWRRP
jgi:hypothetical protein